MRTEKQLGAAIERLMGERYELVTARTKKQAVKLVGQCFKLRNCFSCPEKESDYWWVYLAVTGMDEDGELVVFEFQKDSRATLEVKPRTLYSLGNLMNNKCVAITATELIAAWDSVSRAYVAEFSAAVRQLK